MDTGVLNELWAVLPEGYVFLPRIRGWKVSEKGKLRAENYREGTAFTPETALETLPEWDITGVDVYFTPLTYSKPTRSKECVNPSCVLFADLDDCDPRKLPEELKPTTYWHSSENHFQGLWLLDTMLPPEEFELLNKQMSYAIGADHGGWDLTQILRVPGTSNYKGGYPQPCTLLKHSTTPMNTSRLREVLKGYDLPTVPKEMTTEWPVSKRVIELLEAKEFPVGERSERLWELEKLMAESGMPVAEMFRLLKDSGWNKFAGRKDAETALLKDIMKAEAEYKVGVINSTVETTPRVLTDFYSLVTGDSPRPSYMVDGFLVEGSVGAAAGEPKTMKSTVVLDLAVSVASGKPFLGRYTVNKPCSVLYIQEENSSADIMFRLQRIAVHHGVAIKTSVGVTVADIPLYVMNNEGINLTEKKDCDNIEKIIRENDIHLLILDPWYMMVAGIDEDKSKDVSPVLKYLTSLRNKYNCTVLLVHHFKKGDTARPGQRMRGSSVFHAWVETGLYFRLRKGKSSDIIVDREFRSIMSRGPAVLTFADASEDAYDVLVEETDVPSVTMIAPIKTVTVTTPLTAAEIAGEEDSPIVELSEEVEVKAEGPKTLEECIRLHVTVEEAMKITGLSRMNLEQRIKIGIRTGKISGVLSTTLAGLRC